MSDDQEFTNIKTANDTEDRSEKQSPLSTKSPTHAPVQRELPKGEAALKQSKKARTAAEEYRVETEDAAQAVSASQSVDSYQSPTSKTSDDKRVSVQLPNQQTSPHEKTRWSYAQALDYFKSVDYDHEEAGEKSGGESQAPTKASDGESAPRKRTCTDCFRKRFRFDEAEQEQTLVQNMVGMKYKVANVLVPPQHLRIVEAIYLHLTGEEFREKRASAGSGGDGESKDDDGAMGEAPSSWEDIGFQGTDPGTDLRAGGMFALLQMLWACERESQLVETLYQLSRHPTSGFPFMLVGINATVVCVQALRAGKLFDVCNAEDSLLGGMHRVYARLLRHMRSTWESQQLTVMDFQPVLDGMRAIAMKGGAYE